MGNHRSPGLLFILLLVFSFMIAGCNNTPLGALFGPSATPTVTVTLTPTVTATPSPTMTPTVTSTPPPTPEPFQTDLLHTGDVPYTYITDLCSYLADRWNPNNSPPGTILMPIMIHSITDGEVTNYDQISVQNFQYLVQQLVDNGFTAISMQQAVDFLENNAPIPARSVLLIVDDRKSAEFFNTHFRSLYDQYGWVVVNAWISVADTPAYLWDENAALQAEGWVDHQAHGVVHNIPADGFSSDEFLHTELYGSISAFQDHFGVTPIAYIWPGGGFTQPAIAMAREAGYQVGFTINPRGPLMFNWVPLSGETDPNRPSYMPEGGMGDPLMTLPRYWDTDAVQYIDDVIAISQQAAVQAEQNRINEIGWMNFYCPSTTTP